VIKLRPYQREAVNGIYGYFHRKRGNPLVVVPTGGGKSHIIAQFMKEGWTPGQRFLVVTHVRELIEQNHGKFLQHWPEAEAGVFSAGLNRREVAPITFCGIQSVYKRAHMFGKVDLVLVDEAHLIPKEGEGMYRRFLEDLQSVNPRLKVIGFTATPYRLKGGLLTEGDGRIFTDIAYETDLLKLVEDGYLCDLRPKVVSSSIDITGVKTVAGDFHRKDLETAASQLGVVESCISEIVSQGQDRKSWLVFCCGVDHAELVRDGLRKVPVSVEMVTAKTPQDERDLIIEDFKTGKIRALVNVNVLTTGFDAPGVDLLAVLRPTKSTGLYVQMMGRGMRTAPGKSDCLVLDFGGNVHRHGPINRVRPVMHGKKPGEVVAAPVKECPSCETLVFAGQRTCQYCGYEFPEQEIKHDATASTADVIDRAPPTKEIFVQGVRFLVHKKRHMPDSMRVEYEIASGFAKEWVCIEHKGFAGERARFWWKKMTGNIKYPATVAEAIDRSDEIKKVTHVTIKADGKYIRIIGHRFGDRASVSHGEGDGSSGSRTLQREED